MYLPLRLAIPGSKTPACLDLISRTPELPPLIAPYRWANKIGGRGASASASAGVHLARAAGKIEFKACATFTQCGGSPPNFPGGKFCGLLSIVTTLLPRDNLSYTKCTYLGVLNRVDQYL